MSHPRIYRGVNGDLVGLERDPLQEPTLRMIIEIRNATGWLPVSVSVWTEMLRCPTCKKKYYRSSRELRCSCPDRSWLLPDEDIREVSFTTWWKPWTWGRPVLFETHGAHPTVEYEVLPPPTDNGPATGKLTLVKSQEDPK